MKRHGGMIAGIVLLIAAGAFDVPAAEPLDSYLQSGRIDAALEEYENPRTDEERFSLAVTQVLDGLENFAQGFNELGMRQDSPLAFLPFFRVVIPVAERAPGAGPPTATPAATAKVFGSLRASLRAANETLQKIEGDDFGVPINLTRVRLDFNGDGAAGDEELLLLSLQALMGARRPPAPGDEGLVVRFDAADAIWLRGYTHFLSGFLDILLAYDWRPVWDQCAHTLFYAPDPYPELQRWVRNEPGPGQWVDLIAALHDMRLELKDKKAWPRARDGFRGMIADSRRCWSRVLDETDDEREWLPSPAQTGPRGTTISQEQIDGWLAVLDELEAITRGEKLLPHWRGRPGTGINLERFVDSPPPLDLVLWIQGSALVPYLEEGPVSDDGTWDRLIAPFGPGFLQFAIWSN